MSGISGFSSNLNVEPVSIVKSKVNQTPSFDSKESVELKSEDELKKISNSKEGSASPVCQLVDITDNNKNSASSVKEYDENLKKLTAVQGDNTHVDKILEVIKTSLKPKETLSQATDNLVKVLNKTGSLSYSGAIAVYKTIDKSLLAGESRTSATNEFLKLLEISSKPKYNLAIAVYNGIDESMKMTGNKDRTSATNSFVKLLENGFDFY